MNTCDIIWWLGCILSILRIVIFSSSFGFVFLSCPFYYLHMHALWTPTSHQNVMEKFCEACLQGQSDVRGRCWERQVIKIAQLRFPPAPPPLTRHSRRYFSNCVSLAICFSIIWVVSQKFQFPGHSPKSLIQCFWVGVPDVVPLHNQAWESLF